MADLLVTCPKNFYLEWIEEGDPAGSEPTGEEWGWFMGGPRPPINPGERLYVCAWGRLRGWAPVTRVARTDRGWGIARHGGAVACTIEEEIPGFRGFRKVWWPRSAEREFPDWMTAGLPESELRRYLKIGAEGYPPYPQVAEALRQMRADQGNEFRLEMP